MQAYQSSLPKNQSRKDTVALGFSQIEEYIDLKLTKKTTVQDFIDAVKDDKAYTKLLGLNRRAPAAFLARHIPAFEHGLEQLATLES